MQKAVSRLVAGVNHLCRKKEGRAREESPGGKGHPTSENGSNWWQLVSEEENDRLAFERYSYPVR